MLSILLVAAPLLLFGPHPHLKHHKAPCAPDTVFISTRVTLHEWGGPYGPWQHVERDTTFSKGVRKVGR